MIVGHYATALIPYSKMDRKAPLWLFLLCANLADFLWIFLGLIGIEATNPSSLWLATFQNLSVEMTYSHNALPSFILALIIFGFVYLFTRSIRVSLWCGVLILVHFLSDLLSGYEHHWVGPDSPILGLGLYTKNTYLALTIEAAFGALCLLWYIRQEKSKGRIIRKSKQLALYAIFILGALIWIPTATIPLGDLLKRFF